MRTGPLCVLALALSQRLRRLCKAGLQIRTYMFHDSHNNSFGVYDLCSDVRVATREETSRFMWDSLPPVKPRYFFSGADCEVIEAEV